MRIALTADPELPVPPLLYGGIERIVDMLARGLIARGHEVDLFAHPDSTAPGRLFPWPGSRSNNLRDTLANAAWLARHVARGGYDVVHSFSRIAYLTPILPFSVPKLMTYQREISPRTVTTGLALARGTLEFTAVGAHMITSLEARKLGRWHVIPNGVPLDVYQPTLEVPADAPLVFLGRFEEIKGPHLAIDIALASGRDLILAGNIAPEHQGWFDQYVGPRLDGRRIRYIGPVNDEQKNNMLRAAAAFLMPILWEEPFGIVMAEALACGTPVLGLTRGAVPEVVTDGETGFVRDTVEELTAAVARLPQISRAACRQRAEQLYSDHAVTEAYLQLYRDVARQRP